MRSEGSRRGIDRKKGERKSIEQASMRQGYWVKDGGRGRSKYGKNHTGEWN